MQISRRPQNILRAVLMRRLIWNFIHWLAESCRLIRHPGSWLPNTKISLNVVMLHGVLRHIAAGFLPFLIFPLAIESYWISVAINFFLLGRSEERRVGKECVSTCRSGCAPDH